MIEDLEPDAYQMGISGKSGAKNKAPDGGKAGIKGDFNAMHPRYPKGHPQGGKFMPKGSKDQIKAIAKNTGQSVEKVAAAVGGKAPAEKAKGKISGKELMRRNLAKQEDSPLAEKPRGRVSGKELMRRNQESGTNMAGKVDDRNPATPKSIREAMKGTGTKKGEGKAPAANKGKLGKFSGSAGAVGKAQKVLKNKESTPEQRAKAKANIAKAAGKMRGESPAIAGKAKATPTRSMAATAASTTKKKLSGKELDSALFDKFQSTKEGTASADKAYKILSNRLKPSEKVLNPAASKRAVDKSIARNAKKKAKR